MEEEADEDDMCEYELTYSIVENNERQEKTTRPAANVENIDDTVNAIASGEVEENTSELGQQAYLTMIPWSVVEREKLLTGLKEYGPLDVSKLQKMVGTRTVSEVLLFLKEMKLRSEREIESVHDLRAKAPIENWLKIVGYLLDDHPDYTSEITNVLIKNASALREEPFKNRYTCSTTTGSREDIEFSRILTHLSCLIKGCAVNQLSPIESFVVVQLLQRLTDYVKSLDLKNAYEHLKSINEAYQAGNLSVSYDLRMQLNPDKDEAIFDKSFNPLNIPPEIHEPPKEVTADLPPDQDSSVHTVDIT